VGDARLVWSVADPGPTALSISASISARPDTGSCLAGIAPLRFSTLLDRAAWYNTIARSFNPVKQVFIS
jgi:hypothetical protein